MRRSRARKRRAPSRTFFFTARRALVRLGLTLCVSAAVLGGPLDWAAIHLMRAHAVLQHEDAAGASASTVTPIWTLDVNGDGLTDVANPTLNSARGVDGYGSGAFGAVRDNGHRTHKGTDFVVAPGDDVYAPLSGVITAIGFAYSDDATLHFVEVTDQSLQLVTRVFYVEPLVTIGQNVLAGDVIGVAQSLLSRYPQITNHVHVEITDGRGSFLNPATVVPSGDAQPVLAALKSRLMREAPDGAPATPADVAL